MLKLAGKRLTYAELTGKDGVCPPQAGTGQEEQPF